jgi:hypothetical protein
MAIARHRARDERIARAAEVVVAREHFSVGVEQREDGVSF